MKYFNALDVDENGNPSIEFNDSLYGATRIMVNEANDMVEISNQAGRVQLGVENMELLIAKMQYLVNCYKDND